MSCLEIGIERLDPHWTHRHSQSGSGFFIWPSVASLLFYASRHAHSLSAAMSLVISVPSDVFPITSVGENHGLLARKKCSRTPFPLIPLSDISPRLITEQVFSWLGLKPRRGEKIPTEVIGNATRDVTI